VTVTLVAAMGSNGVIGVDNALPWRLPEDLAHFKQLTLGHPMIMGRATFESIGRPLPGRTTIVLTRDPAWSPGPAEVPGPGRQEGTVGTAPDLDTALAQAGELDDDVFVVGGGQVYAEALERDLVDLLCITRVAQAPDGDTRFPSIDWERWRPVGSIQHDGFEIITYERT
jgi:dihydrofolate reductase